MRHSIKRISKSALSVILALMMVVSTMVVGIVTVSAFDLKGTYNFDNYTAKWDKVYLVKVGNDGKYTEYQVMTAGSDGIYSYTLDSWGGSSFYFANSNSNPTATTAKFTSAVDSTNNCFVPSSATGTSITGTWMTTAQAIEQHSGSTGGGTTYKLMSCADDTGNSTRTEIGTFDENGRLTVTNFESKDYYLYINDSNNQNWFNKSKAFESNQVKLYDYSDDNFAHVIKLSANAGSNYTFTWSVSGSEGVLKYEVTSSSFSLTPSVIGSGTVTYTTGGSEITDFTQKFASGTSITVNATPSTGYQLDSIKLNNTTINNGATFAMPSQDSTVVVTFSLKTPTVTLTPDSTTVNVGESVALNPSVTTYGLEATGVYTVTKDDNSVTASAYISDDTFTTPKSADSAGTYVVTYTATVTSGSDSKSAFATSTITVEQSEEQQAYNTLVTWLADSSKNPDNITGKTTSTLNAYKTAYTTAQTAVSADYPTSGTVNTTALSSLQSAYSALTDKTSLVKPELTALPQYIDITSESKTVTLSVSNASSYPAGANVNYSFYQEGNDTALYTGANSSYTFDVATEGTFNYYVKVNLGNTDDYTCASDTSETKSVIAVTPVTVSVTAGANGSAYVSSYTTYDNQTKSNTNTALTSVKVYPGSSVTFTAVPDEGYVVGVWNTDQSSGSTTYTVANITTATNVNVSFTGKPKFSYALVGGGDTGSIKDSNGQVAAWNGGTSPNPNQADFDSASSLKFTNNKLVVTADKDAQFRFIGTDGTSYNHYGSNNESNPPVNYTDEYPTTKNNKSVYKFSEAGTFEIEITSGTDSPMSFKVTKLATYYITGRFAIKNSDGNYTCTGISSSDLNGKGWNDTLTSDIKFSYAGDSIYKLNTGFTIKELTKSSNEWFFQISDGTNKYRPTDSSSDTALKVSDATNKYATNTTSGKSFYFNDADESGIVILCFNDSTKQFYFEIESGKTPLDAPSIKTNVVSLSTENPTATITVTPADTYPKGMAVEYYLYNGGTYVNKTAGTTFTVHSAGTYTVKAYPPADNPDYKESVDSNSVVISDVRTPVVLKAMHGIKNGEANTGNTVAEAANTSSSVVENTSANLAGGIQYTVTKGSTVKLTTTMVADTTTAEKFVYAYVVNNKDTYLATEGIAATGEGDKKYATYSATFTIDEDATDTTFTVVPIYYYKACANDGEYIKFYVNPSDSSWGNNVYNYTYYLGSTTYESEGNWPGQPMLYDETKQLYYSLVPKEIKGQTVSGLTVNNNGEQQTYDFDDFKYIYESGYDIVRLDLKYRSGHTLNKTTIGASYTTADGFAEPSNTITVDTFAGRWESFNDINGNPMSLLGKEVTGTTKVYVVSTALHDMQTGGENRGKYMTSWYVYQADSNGNLSFVTAACPSDFVPRPYSGIQTEKEVNTSAYNKILDSGLGNSPVQIVFEDGQLYDSKTRIDGRWYYAQSDSEVSAYAYYRTSADGTTYSDLKQDAAYASVDGAVSVTNPKLGLEIAVVSSPLAGYIFSHWSVADKEGNIVINKLDNVGASFTTTLDQEMHYVANFVEAAEGSLVINHGKYVGSDAKGGLGYYRLEVQVYRNGAWTDIKSGTGTGANGQSVTIDVDSATDTYIRIKLITETAGENTFRYWYTRSSDGMEIIEDPDGDMTHNGSSVTEPTGLSGTLAYTFETEVWKLFRDNKQIINQMNFYSDIAPMTKNYKLTYIYDDRFGNQKSYVVTGTHDDQYYVDNKGSWAPNEALIYEKAPYIDDLYKDCTWTMTQCTSDGTDATLIAVQKNKKYTVDIYDSTGKAYDTYQLAINSYVKNNAGQFYVADATYDNKEFSFWAVYERIVGADGKVTQGKEVARHFYRKYTLVVLDNYIIKPVYGAVVEDKAYISDPQYSREQTTNADGTVVTDTLYVDFMLAYMSSKDALIRDNTDGTIKTGVLVEFGPNYKLDVDVNGVATVPDYSSIIYTDSSKDTLELVATTKANGEYYIYNAGDATNKDNRAIYNFTANNSDYNNMNRLDYFVAFKNSLTNRRYVMKAYFYVIVDGKFIVSDSVYFNLYDVGTSDPNTDA